VKRPAPTAGALHAALLPWYAANARDLPWRRTRDPYAIWLSEVMLQQTRVATVVPYWERFQARFPDVRALAAAPDDEVLALWSGLGYYARARNLLRCARAVVERHGGSFPANLEELRDLPGFGPYTAAAVGSLALGLDAAVVDGNVARVLCRLLGWRAGAEEAKKLAEAVAPSLLPGGRAAAWNQALMDLGATICTPAGPACLVCPARASCVASAEGDPSRFPLPKRRRERTRLHLAAIVVRDGDAVWMVRREAEGLFGGLWEPPSVAAGLDQSASEAALRLAASLGADTPAAVGSVKQTLTHRDVEVEVFAAQADAVPDGVRRVTAEGLRGLGLSSLAAKVLRAGGFAPAGGHGRRAKASTRHEPSLESVPEQPSDRSRPPTGGLPRGRVGPRR